VTAPKKAALTAPVDIDLDAMRAARAEANGHSITIRFGGETFEVPPALEWPYDVLTYIEASDFAGAMQAAMGTDDWSRFVTHGPTLADVRDLFTSLAQASGFETPGE
jgi:hypothetical protein